VNRATADAVGKDELDRLAPWRDRAGLRNLGIAPGVVVACSGGADSVALLALAVDAGLDPVAVHVDHGLRASSADEAVAVGEVAAGLGARFLTVSVDIGAGSNLEARARDERYRALERARAELGAECVLVAHTADDQAETVLLNVLRGAAASGLAGMAPRHGRIVRPLLGLRRSELRALCVALELSVFDDPMNDDPSFRRVAIRREVLPLLERVAQRDLVPVLARQADILRAESEYLDEMAAAAWPDADPPSAASLSALPPVLARRALRQWLGSPPPSLAEVERVLLVANGAVRSTELTGGRTVRRASGKLFTTR
jgi:tRNA(Ile)-lysidine synthase